MALVTVDDLRKYMSDISLTANQQQSAIVVLNGTQQTLEMYLGRPVQPVQVREKRRSDGSGDLPLSVTPVHKIISIRGASSTELTVPVQDTTPISASQAARLWDAMPLNSAIIPGGVYVGSAFNWFVVEYIGGYNGYVDDSLKLQILEVASRTMTVNHDDTLSIKDDVARETANAASIEKGWRQEELARFDRLRRRTAYR